MSRRFRWTVIIIVLGLSLYKMTPLTEKVRLGLDLQGGMHVVLKVDTDAAVANRLDVVVSQLRKRLQDEGVPVTNIQKTPPNSLVVWVGNGSMNSKVIELSNYYGLKHEGTSDGKIKFSFTGAVISQIKSNAVLQALEVIRNRVDEFGVSEPLIQRQGDNTIVVQLPGITDPDRAMRLIGQTAQLRFYLVDDNVAAADMAKGRIPLGSTVLKGVTFDGRMYELSAKETELTGEMIEDARVHYSKLNEPYVSFELDPLGTSIFKDITTRYVGRQLAIVLDNTVYSAPRINGIIPNGQGMITGQFSLDEAQDLAIVLRSGSMPAPISIDENRTVGPSLGLESIRSGVKACIIGLALISVFMLIYYRLSGLVANIGLVCNFIVLLGALCWLGATLTMPGIAGIILTLGIAVDSNVLIFERVREELRHGRTVLNAFEIGYQKAFATIVDANVTSLIAAVVLFQFGTGPVKGFAVTLSLGLIASMFTAVFITKTVFMEFIIRKNSKTISI